MVRVARRDERLVEDQAGCGETGVDVTEGPLLGGFAHGQLPFGHGEVPRPPLECPAAAAAHTAHAAAPGGGVDSAGACVGAAGVQALQGVDHEFQRLDIEPDRIDGILCGAFVHGRHGEDRVADEQRFVAEQRAGALVVGRQDTENAFHRQRVRGIDSVDAGVGHRAGQQLGENHALGAEILGVPGPTGDLGAHVGRHEILADQVVGHGGNSSELMPRCAGHTSTGQAPGRWGV